MKFENELKVHIIVIIDLVVL